MIERLRRVRDPMRPRPLDVGSAEDAALPLINHPARCEEAPLRSDAKAHALNVHRMGHRHLLDAGRPAGRACAIVAPAPTATARRG